MKKRDGGLLLIVTYVMLALSFLLAFVLFKNRTDVHIRTQNVEQARDNTLLTAAHIEEKIENGNQVLATVAELYAASADTPENEDAVFGVVAGSGMFDEFDFMGADGIAKGYAAGRIVRVNGRDYFKRGMQGESGVTVVFGSFSGHTVVLYYTPAVYGGVTRGVLIGMDYAEDCFKTVFDLTDLNRSAKTWLVTSDGYVLTSSEEVLPGTTVFYTDGMNDGIKEAIRASSGTGETVACEISEGKTGCCIATPVIAGGWTLVQYFPDSSFLGRYQTATNGLVQLAFFLLVIFCLFFFVMVYYNRRENERLKTEIDNISAFRKAVQSDARILLRTNLVKNVVTEGEWKDAKGRKLTSEQLVGLRLPCSYDVYLERWCEHFVQNEYREAFLANTDRAFLIKSFGEGKTEITFDYGARELDGEKLYLRRTISMVRHDDTGELIAYTSVKDVTESVRASREENARVRQALEHAQSEKRLFGVSIANMCHDVRTPMNSLISYADIAFRKADVPEAVRFAMQKLSTAWQHIMSLLQNVSELSVSSPEAGKREDPCDLYRLGREIRAMMLPGLLERDIRFAIDLSGVYEPVVYADKLKLSEVLFNLADNALGFTPEGGSVVCSVHQMPDRSEQRVRCVFTVRDGGSGLGEGEIRELMDGVNEDADEAHRGFAIIRNLSGLMGGRLNAVPVPGQGTEFSMELTLDVCRTRNEVPDERIERMDAEVLAGQPVLVTDDDPAAANLAAAYLTEMGFRVTLAASGEECLNILNAENAEDYKLVLMDMHMPGMDGCAAAAKLRSMEHPYLSRLPIIAVTENLNGPDRRRAFGAGMNAYIAKPYDKEKLKKTVQMVL